VRSDKKTDVFSVVYLMIFSGNLLNGQQKLY